jgi:hypothetical protein
VGGCGLVLGMGIQGCVVFEFDFDMFAIFAFLCCVDSRRLLTYKGEKTQHDY